MQWIPFILVTALFGVNCGNRLVGARYRNSFPSNGNSYDGAKAINKAYAKSLKDLITDENEELHKYLSMQNRIGGKSLAYCNRNERNRLLDDIDVEGFRQLLADNDKIKASSSTPLEVTDVNRENAGGSALDSDSAEVEAAPPPTLQKSLTTTDLTVNRNAVDSTNQQLPNLSDVTYSDFYKDLVPDVNKVEEKRGLATTNGCDCKVKNDLLDLGQQHFPRYLLNAVCYSERTPNEYPPKCWPGAICRPLEYKVKVLTFRSILDHSEKDPALAWLPDDLRQVWKFKTVTVAAGCFCSY